MSDSCPPQLHLELPPNSTSFKRSFDQFGFDLESPLAVSDGAGASAGDGNDRNKRARSASSFSDDDDRSIGSSSSTLASGSSPISGDSSTHASAMSSHPRLPVPHLSLTIARASLEPPRLPTPEIHDIVMTDYPLPAPVEAQEAHGSLNLGSSNTSDSATSTASQAEETYRLSLERFNAFDTQIAALRRSRSPSLPRPLTPPPVLPPLELLGEEASINTNTISFLHPPAQPSPPLPHSLYSYGPSRNQQPGSRTTSRNERDLRRLSHETHVQTERSTPARDLVEDDDDDDESDSQTTDEEWNRITRNVRSARGDGTYHNRPGTPPWAFWAPGAGAQQQQQQRQRVGEIGDDNRNNGEEAEEEEVQEVLERPSGDIWSSPVPPTLGELRSPSPLFNHLPTLDPQPPPAPTLPSARRDENAAPPILPPIQGEVLANTWDVPIEEVLDSVWSRYPGASHSRQQQQQQQQQQRQTQPSPRISIAIPSTMHETERERGTDENVSVGGTTGSVSDIVPPTPTAAPATHIHGYRYSAPAQDFWDEHGDQDHWLFRGSEEEEEEEVGSAAGRAEVSSTSTSTRTRTTGTTGATTSANPNANVVGNMLATRVSSASMNSSSTSNSIANTNTIGEVSSGGSASASTAATAVGPSILDTYAASRLQALQGIGTALEGIGQVLRQSELTLGPYLREGGSGVSAETSMNNGVGNLGTGNAMGEGRESSVEGRTSAWRSTLGNRPRVRTVSGVQPSYIESDWTMPDESSEPPLLADSSSPSETFRETVDRMSRRRPSESSRLGDDTEESESPVERMSESRAMRIFNMMAENIREHQTESFRTVYERLARRLSPSPPPIGSLETLRQRAVALEASVRSMDEDYRSDRSVGVGTGDGRMSEMQEPLMRLFEANSWGDNPPGASTRRERELPANTSMLFDDGPSASASWRTAESVIPRVRDPPSQSPEREREMERERTRLNERPWSSLRPPRVNSGTATLGTSLSNLRARPYVSQSSTHTHSYSQLQQPSASAPSFAPLLSASSNESAADAQRRIARLGLIQMQRQRVNSGRMPSVESPFASSASSTFATRPLPARPRGFESFPPRSSSPDRNSYRMRLAEQRARFDGLRESDTTSSLYDAAMDTLDLFNFTRPRNVGETSPERSHPPPVLHYLRRSFDRPAESTFSDTLFSSSASSSNNRRSRFPTVDHSDRPREPSAEFLPVPSLPSPGLEFEFAPPASNGSGASEPHNEHRTFTSRSSRPEVPHAVPARRSPSPMFRRQRSPPPPGFSRELDPEAFAPGPFRNTIQSFWPARNTRTRMGSQSRVSPTRTAQALVTPPSLPPLAFEEEHRPAQRPDRSNGDLNSLYRNGPGENSTAQLRALLNRHPSAEGPPTSQRFGDFLDSPLDVLGRILLPQNNTTQSTSTSTSANGAADERNLFDTTPAWLPDDNNSSSRRSPASNHRPPWRPSQAPRHPRNPPPDLHDFLNRHRRTEAIGREARRPLPLRGNEDGFNHAIESLRNDSSSTGRSQELSNRFQRDTSRELRARVPASPWGILEQNQDTGSTRRTSPSSDRSDVEQSIFQRRRRNLPPVDPLQMDVDDDDIDVVSLFHDHAHFLARRIRGPGEAPVFPRRIPPTFLRPNSGANMRRGRPLGDYVRDEDWNSDYENLLSLAAQLGEVKPRHTPEEVINKLETGLYRDWKTADSDHRCPICLDDYQPDDAVLKLSGCSHWLHSECLQQWLKGATTCPVCRETVVGPSQRTSSDPSNEAGPSQRRGPRDGHGAGGSNEGGGEGAGSSTGLSSLDPRRPRRFL